MVRSVASGGKFYWLQPDQENAVVILCVNNTSLNTDNSFQVSLIHISFQGSKWNTTHMVSVRKGSGSKTLIFRFSFLAYITVINLFHTVKIYEKNINVYFHVVKTAMKHSKLDTGVHNTCTATVMQEALLIFFFIGYKIYTVYI